MATKPPPRRAASMPAIVQSTINGVRVVAYGRRPTEDEFEAHIREAVAMEPTVRAVLIVGTDEHASLNPKGRAMLRDAGILAKPTAVVTPLSTIARNVLTALSWMGGNMRGFGPDRLDEACDFLRVPPERRAALVEEVAVLKRKVGCEAAIAPTRRSRTNRAAGGTQTQGSTKSAAVASVAGPLKAGGLNSVEYEGKKRSEAPRERSSGTRRTATSRPSRARTS